jgi:hypothetical protein
VRPIAVRASLNDDLAWRAADGRVETGWYTDIQRPGHTLTLDFGRLVSGTALRMEQGGRPLEYPRLLEIDRSVDGLMWSSAWAGPAAALAWQAAIESPRTMPLTIPLDGSPARYLRLRLVAESPTQRWSVAEVSMLEPAPKMVPGTICRP